MVTSTLTRLQIAEELHQNIGLSRTESAEILQFILATVVEALDNGESVKISSFGTFNVRQKRERVGRNPRTNEEVSIAPRRVVTFKPSHLMKERVNLGNHATRGQSLNTEQMPRVNAGVNEGANEGANAGVNAGPNVKNEWS